MWAYTTLWRVPLLATIQGRLFFIGTIVSFIIAIGLIDPLGLRAILPPVFYLLLDEIVSALLFTMALMIVDFWASAAKGVRAHNSGLPRAAFFSLVVLSFVNFLGLQLVGLFVPQKYYDFVAYKMFAGAAILLVMAVVTRKNVNYVKMTLLSVQQDRSVRIMSGSIHTDTSEGGLSIRSFAKLYQNLRMHAKDSRERVDLARRIVAQLEAKNRKFFAIIGLTGVVFITYGVLCVIRPPELKTLGFRINKAEVYITLVVLRFVYLAVLLLVLHFFQVPSTRSIVSRPKPRATTESLFMNDNSKSFHVYTGGSVNPHTTRTKERKERILSEQTRSENPVSEHGDVVLSVM
eukprot:CAMPEP_0171529284 /NCGR_PEP_ID=MMETSP0959-20130129/12271_1 /TAXON_ID=87120 /ORGANISM="Aurantiochytrium limacinum, Strain ATCCMYA-1381" /LENGTH=347 /DNA_ID=CAMNT_0012071617 /DNA_START=646 /DNA_END=1689 /DNA_ORIENTATION=+